MGSRSASFDSTQESSGTRLCGQCLLKSEWGSPMEPCRPIICVAVCVIAVWPGSAGASDPVPTPRIESVAPAKSQPHAGNPAVIWYDNFDHHDAENWRYEEPRAAGNTLTDREALGGAGMSMELFYAKGERGRGNRKLFFGDSPVGDPVRPEESFDDVYWRIYVKHQPGWAGGGPAKMSRATIMASPDNWSQACILHVWGSGLVLTLDPATGVKGDSVVTTRYNDFANLRWLGNKPRATFPIHSTEASGWWVGVEARLKLNTPGKADGYAALWIDGRLEAERHEMDFRGSWAERGINAIFLEAYWNNGSPVDQYRWYDDFVVSTEPIGPVIAGDVPEVIGYLAANSEAWQIEVGEDGGPATWRSSELNADHLRVSVDTASGTFLTDAENPLNPGAITFCRARQKVAGAWSEWSPWHQPFRTGSTDTSGGTE
jgi:hypothetical protein